jgi:ferric-dicitrate binding protein FerR (iron transport regulator)
MKEQGSDMSIVTRLDATDPLGRLIARAGARLRPPAAIEATAREATRAAWREEIVRRRSRRLTAFLAVAACALGAAGIAWHLGGAERAATDVVAGTVEAAVGTVRLRAPDGSVAKVGSVSLALHPGDRVDTGLDGGARVTLANDVTMRIAPSSRVAWIGAERVRLEAGGVFVSSGGPAGALVIDTPFWSVTHLGTHYQVIVDPEHMTVRVRDGQVRLDNSAATLVADARDQLTIDVTGKVERSTVAPWGPEWRWADALAAPIEIESIPLPRFLEWVAGETGRRIDYADSAVNAAAATTVLHGSIVGMSPEEALDAVLATTEFRARRQGERLIIERTTN